MTTLYLCGASNPEGVRLALAVNAADSRWEEIRLLDDDSSKHGRVVLGVRVLGGLELLGAVETDSEAANLVARSTIGRAKCRERILSFGVDLVPLVHPSVDVFGVELRGDVIVYAQAVVSAGSRVGPGCVLFTGSVVGHGSTLGNGCVLAPGAVTNARVVVEDGAYLGTNSSVLPELRIGAGATVAAGSSVMADVPPQVTVLGVPAKKLGQANTSEPGKRDHEPDPQLLRTLVCIWQELLGLDEVGLRDNFFDVGGTSRLALDLALRIGESTGVALGITDIFRFTTITELAVRIEGGVESSSRARSRAVTRRARRSA